MGKLKHFATYAVVALGLAGLLGFALLTNYPDQPWIEAAEAWPIVGPMAEWFRAGYVLSARPETIPTAEPPTRIVRVVPPEQTPEATRDQQDLVRQPRSEPQEDLEELARSGGLRLAPAPTPHATDVDARNDVRVDLPGPRSPSG